MDRRKRRYRFKGRVITRPLSEVEANENGYIIDGLLIKYKDATIIVTKERGKPEFVSLYIN
jgi:hypothetical protein